MNLKRINDNLYINSETWTYTPIKGKNKTVTGSSQSNLGLKFTGNKLFKMLGNNAYALMNVIGTKKTKFSDGKLETEEVSIKEVLHFLKYILPVNGFSNKTLVGWQDLINDLKKSFIMFLTDVVAPDTKKFSTKYIDLHLNLIKSRSQLTKLVVEQLANQKYSVDGKTYTLTYDISFKKGSNIYVDADRLKSHEKFRLKERYDESKTEQIIQKLNRALEKIKTEGKGVSDITGGPYSRYRDFIVGLSELDHFKSDYLVDLIVDDISTTGATLNSMERNIRSSISEKEDILIYKLAIFSH